MPFVEAVGMTMEEITDIDSYTEYLYKVKEMDANGNGDPDDEVPLFLRGSGYLALLGMYWGMDLAIAAASDWTKTAPWCATM